MARILITAGPTYEPIDAVRFIGNRSSGKLGSILAQCACESGWEVRLLLGPNATSPAETGIKTIRFSSSQDLESKLGQHLAWCDCLVMAAAVADYRPNASEVDTSTKRRRSGEDLNIALESTPDLLAGCSKNARADQLLVGFALEPADQLEASAKRKLIAKNIDLIVANPLETMDADSIHARLIGNLDRGINLDLQTDGPITKQAFAPWLLNHLNQLVAQRLASSTPHPPHTPHTPPEHKPHVSI